MVKAKTSIMCHSLCETERFLCTTTYIDGTSLTLILPRKNFYDCSQHLGALFIYRIVMISMQKQFIVTIFTALWIITTEAFVSPHSSPKSYIQISARKKKASENENTKIDDDDGNKKDNILDAKKEVLDGVVQKIERDYGRGSILKLGDASGMVVDCIASGSLTLDAALGGGGYPKGRVVEIYGPESSGKTTLALHAIAAAQRDGGMAAFVDAEHALDPSYAAKLGVDVEALWVSQPDSGEMALDIVDRLVRSSAVDVIVLDSVAALVPRAELEGDMSDQQIGLQARLMSKALRKITGSLALSQCTVIFLNQLRSKVGVYYGSPEVTAGGNALKFYASVRLDTRRKEVLPDNAGIRVKVKVVKNKIAAPFKAVMLDILFGSGIDSMGCTIDAALDLGIIDRRGSWYAFKGKNLAQGRQNLVELFKQHQDLASSLEMEVKSSLSQLGVSVTTSSSALITNDFDASEAEPELELEPEPAEIFEADNVSFE
jgi:recombination protein RecA